MDLGQMLSSAAGPGGAADEPRAKRVAVEKGPDMEKDDYRRFKEFLVILSKLCLSNAQMSRVFQGILLTCWMLPAECELCKSLKTGTKSHSESLEKLRDEGLQKEAISRKIGAPYVVAWLAMGKWVYDTLRTHPNLKEQHAALAKTIEDYLQTYQQMGIEKAWPIIQKEVKHFRLADAYNKAYKKLLWNVRENTEASRLVQGLLLCLSAVQDARAMDSVPPPGDLERRVQQWLDEQSR